MRTPSSSGTGSADGFAADHPAYQAHHAALRSLGRAVPEGGTGQDPVVAREGIRELLRRRPLVITGAGVSTDSGIPDYRGPQSSLRQHRPMTYQEFRYDPAANRRYWARSFVGWRHMNIVKPNRAHQILAAWNAAERISGIVTQNVDGLHAEAAQRSGTQGPLVTLHGDLGSVVCLNCGAEEERSHLDQRFEEANPDYVAEIDQASLQMNPDGDVTLPEEWVERFHMVRCLVCGSEQLKPAVVYFGEAVPAERKHRAQQLLNSSGGLLVIGSSLAVMSGFKFVLDALQARKPVGIINGGPTRADNRATYQWRTKITPALNWLDTVTR